MRVYVVGPLCLTGIILNLVGVYIIGRDCIVQTTIRFLLRMMAVADTGLLVTSSVLIIVQPVAYVSSNESRQSIALFIGAGWYVTSMAAVWCVVQVAAERYVVTWHPLLADKCTTIPRLRLVAIVIWVGSIAFSMPRFFEHWVIAPSLTVTAMGTSEAYFIVYRVFLYYLFHFSLPCLFLVFFVHCLIQSVRQNSDSRRQLQQHSAME